MTNRKASNTREALIAGVEDVLDAAVEKGICAEYCDVNPLAIGIIDLCEQHFNQGDEINNLKEALVYVAFASHRTPLRQLPRGIILSGNDTVEVKLNAGITVTAISKSPPLPPETDK